MYYTIAHYALQPVIEPEVMIKRHKKFLKELGAKGRIYISEEGINTQVSIPEATLEKYRLHLQTLGFDLTQLKIEKTEEPCFARLHVRHRSLVGFDPLSSLGETGTYLTPKQWKEVLENDEDILLIDARNDYESDIGYFKGALKPQESNFRDFVAWTRKLKTTVDPETVKVLTYCTGGIRCEYYTPFLKKEGFKHVYHLEGGIIQYGLEYGNLHWDGRLFVFDDRLSISLAHTNQTDTIIGCCAHCHTPCDVHINCANMLCNRLVVSCASCREEYKGCCSSKCMGQEHTRRHLSSEERPKPFRRLSDLSA